MTTGTGSDWVVAGAGTGSAGRSTVGRLDFPVGRCTIELPRGRATFVAAPFVARGLESHAATSASPAPANAA